MRIGEKINYLIENKKSSYTIHEGKKRRNSLCAYQQTLISVNLILIH